MDNIGIVGQKGHVGNQGSRSGAGLGVGGGIGHVGMGETLERTVGKVCGEQGFVRDTIRDIETGLFDVHFSSRHSDARVRRGRSVSPKRVDLASADPNLPVQALDPISASGDSSPSR